jgi:hypothetical protein
MVDAWNQADVANFAGKLRWKKRWKTSLVGFRIFR